MRFMPALAGVVAVAALTVAVPAPGNAGSSVAVTVGHDSNGTVPVQGPTIPVAGGPDTQGPTIPIPIGPETNGPTFPVGNGPDVNGPLTVPVFVDPVPGVSPGFKGAAVRDNDGKYKPHPKPLPPGSGDDYHSRDVDRDEPYLTIHGPSFPLDHLGNPHGMGPREVKEKGLWMLMKGDDNEELGKPCKSNHDCSVAHLCKHGFCTVAFKTSPEPTNACTRYTDCLEDATRCIDGECTPITKAVDDEVEDKGLWMLTKSEPTDACTRHIDCLDDATRCIDGKCTLITKPVNERRWMLLESEDGTEYNTSEFDQHCKVNTDCNSGSLCLGGWCTAGQKDEDGNISLPARDIVVEDDDFWYLQTRNAMDVLDELSGNVSPQNVKNKCPKKCDGTVGKHRCCPNQFCQPPKCR